jgi:hypothetical protein
MEERVRFVARLMEGEEVAALRKWRRGWDSDSCIGALKMTEVRWMASQNKGVTDYEKTEPKIWMISTL